MTVLFTSSKKAGSEDRPMSTEMQSNKTYVDEPWYRNPWVWLIIAIPSLTVIGGLITIYLAFSRPAYLVNDVDITEETPTSQSR